MSCSLSILTSNHLPSIHCGRSEMPYRPLGPRPVQVGCPESLWEWKSFCGDYYSWTWTEENLIQVTVAGVMATWCFDYGHARHCRSFAIWSLLYRSLTFSFGSICFGSLLMAVGRVIRYFIESAKQQQGQ